MKLTAFFLIISLHLSAGASSQNVTISGQNMTLAKIFRAIKKQTGYSFIYSEGLLSNSSLVTLQCKETPLTAVLDLCFKPQPFSYSIINKTIVISPKDRLVATSQAATKTQLILPVPIKGRVTDGKDNPLASVTVSVKGKSQKTLTDERGNFSIELPDNKAVLIFSSVGFKAQEVAVGNQSVINVSLLEDTKDLDQVIVIGYGTTKRSDLTGSVSKVGEYAIKSTPIVSFDRAMQGRATGVQVQTNSARPGGSATIRIRGSGSINASNDPLYVIDGFPISSGLNSINSDDIESIEILKDASATAIYGSRGSNGVVLVTTKRGKTGKTVVSYDGYYGGQSVIKTIPLLNAREYAEFVNEALVNGGGQPYFNGTTADRPLPATLGEGTNWQDQVFQKAPMQNHNIALSGGEGKTKYALSLGYYDQDGIIKKSNFQRYSLRVNLDNEISSHVKTGITMQGAYTTTNNARTEVDGNAGGGVTSTALSFAPVFPLYNADGTYYKNLGTLNGFSVDNPLAIVNELTNRTTLIRILANAFLEYKIVEGLAFRTSAGIDLQSAKTNTYATRNTYLGSAVSGLATISASQTTNWLNENTLSYNKTFGAIHNVNALVGYTIQGNTGEDVTANGNTFTSDFATYNNIGAGSSLVAPSSGASDWRLISYIARVNYGFDNRFLLTLTARRDGSSRFGPNNKIGYFPSSAVAWKVINEKWFARQKLLSDAKLRFSYGSSGNQDIGNYRYLANITNATYVLANTLNSGSYPGGIANADLRWEKNTQLDAGADIGFFDNRIQITADYYVKTTSDLLFNVNVPAQSGFTSVLKNIGKLENRGLELAISTVNISNTNSGKEGFTWKSDFNISFNKNKILVLDGRPSFTTGTDAQLFATALNPILLQVGSPVSSFYGRVMDGIFQSKDDVAASAQKTAAPGDIRYKDLNNDGVINDNDRMIIGNANPKFFGGLNNSISFKHFDLNIFVQGSYGNDILNVGRFDLYNLTGGNNQSAEIANRWTATNPSNTIPRANSAGGSRILSTFQIEDGSYLRFKNISLGYNLPADIARRVGASSVHLYVAGQNLITITKYSGYDPEVNRYGSSSLSQGLDYGAYPNAKTILVGLNLKF